MYIYLYAYTHICIYKEPSFILYHVLSIIQVHALKQNLSADDLSPLYYTLGQIALWFLYYSIAYRAKMQLGQLRWLTLIWFIGQNELASLDLHPEDNKNIMKAWTVAMGFEMLEFCSGHKHSGTMMLDLPDQLFSHRPRNTTLSLGPLTAKPLLTHVVWVKKKGFAWHFALKYLLTTCEIDGIIGIFCQFLTLLFVTFGNFSCRVQHLPMSCLFSLTSGQDLVSSLIICLQPEQRSNQIWGYRHWPSPEWIFFIAFKFWVDAYEI